MRPTRELTGWAVALLLTLSIVPVSPAFGASGADLTEHVGAGAVDWTAGRITVTGSGAPPDHGNAAQKRLMTRRAAVVDGYRQLAEILSGGHVDSQTEVKDFVTQSDTIRTQVSALVKGAQPGPPVYQSDGSIDVTLSVPMYGQDGLAAAVNLADHHHGAQSSALPRTTDVVPLMPGFGRIDRPLQIADVPYTGVIVDCSQTGAQPAMSPTILDDSQTELYIGKLPVDPDLVVNEGIAGYQTSLTAAQAASSRVGDHPLILTAQSAAGRFKSDIVISAADAATLRQADQQSPFLAQAKVCFVIAH